MLVLHWERGGERGWLPEWMPIVLVGCLYLTLEWASLAKAQGACRVAPWLFSEIASQQNRSSLGRKKKKPWVFWSQIHGKDTKFAFTPSWKSICQVGWFQRQAHCCLPGFFIWAGRSQNTFMASALHLSTEILMSGVWGDDKEWR